LKQSAVIDVGALYRECDSAFSALSELLGDDRYFFSAKDPGLFDASVFAYTHLLLDEGMKWKERRMVDILKGYENLVKHRRRILDEYFPRKSI
jgi:metaxin